MWETAIAFAIWGSYGSALTVAHIDPVLTAIARSAAVGIILTVASASIVRLSGPKEISAAIPWRSGALWIAGSVLLVDPRRITLGFREQVAPGVRVVEAINPSTLAKSRKSEAELAFVREAADPKDATKKYTTTWFDMFRIEGGKIAEHWDPAPKQ